ncbi:MAG: tetratricopeptide repeat protein [Verrucomicrobia bacterium]|nr:tetratricopeptide repeat protein [Verrucomicrobiota bacterium]
MIVWNRCSPCHRAGQAAPFSLLTYADVKKRTTQIAEVTARRIMPPWSPETGEARFENERLLTASELGRLQQWIAEGAVEGNLSDLPSAPNWPDGWFLGPPDLVVTMPLQYTLDAEGRDVYRNFVIPIPTDKRRYVKAIELRPGNSRIVHHAFMYIDRTQQSRRLAAKEPQPGFPGIRPPDGVQMPEGQFLSYQPGKMPLVAPEGLAWTLEPKSDLVLQVHMNPTGKPETLQSSIGFYFTDHAPTNTPFKMVLNSLSIEIPPGESNYAVTDSFTLPVDASVVGVLPHAHYVAREMIGTATLPDGITKKLIEIKNWDFKWQGDYRYAEPILLPKGTTLAMRYTYDNSTNNIRNPNNPPKLISYGAQSSDEMGELWLQLLVRDAGDRSKLSRAYAQKTQALFFESSQHALRKNPNDAKAHLTLGTLLCDQGKRDEALQHFTKAIELKPDYQQAYFDVGVLLLQEGWLPQAQKAFEAAVRLDPADNRAQGSLGNVYLRLGQLPEATAQFEKALRLNPDDAIARENIELIRQIISEQTKNPSPASGK